VTQRKTFTTADEADCPSSLAGYRVLEKIGEGQSSVVYRCEDQNGVQVALKVLRPEHTPGSTTYERMVREAKALQRVHSPRVLHIERLIESSEAAPLTLVMEYLEGETLRRMLDRGHRFSIPRVIFLAIELTEAVDAVHQAGLIHRDLNPKNVLIAETNEGPSIKLLDFGAVRATEADEFQSVTEPGTSVGTPRYMAPEQVIDGDVDERTDVHAIGLILYEMLSGRVPYRSTVYSELMLQLVTDPPPPLDLGNERLARELERVVERCLAKEPTSRYQSVAELKDALMALEVERCQQPIAATSGTIEQAPQARDQLSPIVTAEIAPPRLFASPPPQSRSWRWWWLLVVIAAASGGLLAALLM
jgi:serine/threonine protein kinase